MAYVCFGVRNLCECVCVFGGGMCVSVCVCFVCEMRECVMSYGVRSVWVCVLRLVVRKVQATFYL